MKGLGRLWTAPKHLPTLPVMLDDIGCSAAALAAHAGVSKRSVYAWIAAGVAPRPIMLALFYETQWGRQYVACDSENRARLASDMYLIERGQRKALQAALDLAVRAGEFGSANEPTQLASAGVQGLQAGTGAAAPSAQSGRPSGQASGSDGWRCFADGGRA